MHRIGSAIYVICCCNQYNAITIDMNTIIVSTCVRWGVRLCVRLIKTNSLDNITEGCLRRPLGRARAA